jgi:hypothetical protein
MLIFAFELQANIHLVRADRAWQEAGLPASARVSSAAFLEMWICSYDVVSMKWKLSPW